MRRGRGAEREEIGREAAATRVCVTGRARSRECAGAVPCSPVLHTKPRRGENGGRGRSGGRGGGDGAQNGGGERRARRAERQRDSGPERVSITRFLVPGQAFRGAGSVRSVSRLLLARPRPRPFPRGLLRVRAAEAVRRAAGRPRKCLKDCFYVPGFEPPLSRSIQAGATPRPQASGHGDDGAGPRAGESPSSRPACLSGDLGRGVSLLTPKCRASGLGPQFPDQSSGGGEEVSAQDLTRGGPL